MSKELAINGGTPAIQPALPERFHFGKEEKAAVDALFDQAIATGKAPGYNGVEETEFCKEFAAELGGGFADGVNAGTNAVFVALRALHLPPLSEVVFGCITDAGGAMPIVMNNCIPIPADTQPGTFMPGPKEIEARITERTRAIVIALGRGFAVQGACLLALAATVGGNAIWFAPLISEVICLSLALVFLKQSRGKELETA